MVKKLAEEKIVTEKTTQYLTHVFTDDELTEKAQEMAKNTIIAKDLEERKKAVTSDFKSQIDQANLATNIAAKHIQDGHEYRNIDCKKELNFSTLMVKVIRVDTGEEVINRKMNEGEKQMTIKGFEQEIDKGDGLDQSQDQDNTNELGQGEKF